MPTTDEITQKIIEIAASVANLPKVTVTTQSNFVDDLGFDSLDAQEFTMHVEKEFGVSIADEQREEMPTVQHFVDFVVAHQS